MPKAAPALPEVFVSIALCRFGENEVTWENSATLVFMSLSCYEYVKVKCM